MQDSMYEAIYTGVYILIFIIAISVSIFLFYSVYDYSELAFEYQNRTLSDSVTINAPSNKYRLVDGSEVITYFFNYIKHDTYGENVKKTNYIISIKNISGREIVSSNSNANIVNTYNFNKLINSINVKSRYILKYVKETSNDIYVDLIEATDEQINALV